MKLDIKRARDVLREVAPSLATALGGPLAGTAVSVIAGKLGREGATLEELAPSIAAAKPDDLIALKELELEFAADMERAGIELARVEAGDRESARRRQTQMRDWTPTALGLAIILGFFGVLAFLFRVGLPAQGGEVLLILVGALSAMTTQVGNYFFGSSTGSKAKDDIISDLRGALR
ncbi:MAG: hypothetical protein ACU0CO_01275 [Shimia sp.]